MQASTGTPAQTLRTSLAGLLAELRGDSTGAVGSRASPLLLPALLLLYVVAMTIFAAFVRNWAPMHADSAEMLAWGRDFALGYTKHPPLGAWVAGAWFTVMPCTNWSFNLLGTMVAVSGLVGVWKLAGLYVDGHGQRLAILPLLLTPAFTTWVFKYNANSILLGVWPWAAYFFLRMIETRALLPSVAAGVFAALAMLGKYYSIVLLATLFCVLMVHPERDRVLRSRAPYVAMLAGAIVLAPHAWWLWERREIAFMHAVSRTTFDPESARITTLRSLVGGLMTLIGPALLLAFAFGADLKTAMRRLGAGAWAPAIRPVLVLAWGPLIFTILAYLLGNVRIGGEFLLPAFFAIPLLMILQVGSWDVLVVRRATGGALAVFAAGALLAPVIGLLTFMTARHPLLEPRPELAAAATDFWRGATNRPLRLVAGQERAATGIVFYSEDQPRYMDGASGFWFDRATPEIKRDGLLFVCGSDDAGCPEHARKVLGEAGFQRFTFKGSHQVLWGFTGPMYTFELYLLPPER
jgi:hypothetical protein